MRSYVGQDKTQEIPLLSLALHGERAAGDLTPSDDFAFQNQNNNSNKKLHVLKEMISFILLIPNLSTAPGSLQCRCTSVNPLHKQPKPD